MAKKNKRKVKFRLFFFVILFISIIGYLSYNLFSNIDRIMEIKKAKIELDDKLANLKDEENTLNSDIKKLKDPDYVARYARKKYMYSKDGELIIRIPDDE